MPKIKAEYLIQFDNGKMCATVDVYRNRIIAAAPILRYMLGWTKDRAMTYATDRGWKKTIIHPEGPYRG